MRTCTKCLKEKDLDQYYVSLGKIKAECKTCNGLRIKAYREKHKERFAAYIKEYNFINRDARLGKQKIRNKIYRQTHKEQSNNNSKRSQTRRKEWFAEIRKTFACESCGFSDHRALQFHHKDPAQKIMGVTNMLYRGWPKSEVLKELSKCACLCANCHFIEHYEQRLEKANSTTFGPQESLP